MNALFLLALFFHWLCLLRNMDLTTLRLRLRVRIRILVLVLGLLFFNLFFLFGCHAQPLPEHEGSNVAILCLC